jgi:hypothetical protein
MVGSGGLKPEIQPPPEHFAPFIPFIPCDRRPEHLPKADHGRESESGAVRCDPNSLSSLRSGPAPREERAGTAGGAGRHRGRSRSAASWRDRRQCGTGGNYVTGALAATRAHMYGPLPPLGPGILRDPGVHVWPPPLGPGTLRDPGVHVWPPPLGPGTLRDPGVHVWRPPLRPGTLIGCLGPGSPRDRSAGPGRGALSSRRGRGAAMRKRWRSRWRTARRTGRDGAGARRCPG